MSVAEPRLARANSLAARVRNDDAALVRRTQAGDEQAFASIFKRHHAPLLSYCRHMLGNRDEGEDALQQTFVKAHRALLGGTTPRELRPWLYAIARNCCLSAIAARRPTAPLHEHTPAFAGLSEEVRRREDLRELVAAIGRLPEDQRSALLLAELDDLSHRAIATIVGCPVSKVKGLVYQARSALIAERDARETPCQDIREQLAVARGGELRRGPLRRHLSLCAGCRDFQIAVSAQHQSLACVLPVAPSAGLVAAIFGHVGAHTAGAAGIGGVGAAGAPAGTSIGVTSAGATAIGGGGTAASGTAVGATATATAGAGTSVGALVGGGLVTKLAIGGAVVALATAGAVAVHRRPAGAVSSRVGSARLAAFAAHGMPGGGGASDPYGAAAPIAEASDGLPGTPARESSTALTGASDPASPAGVDPFTGSTNGASALTLTDGASPSSMALTAIPRQPAMKAGQDRRGETSSAKARKARAELRHAALARRARLLEARRRALRHRHRAAPKALEKPKPAAVRAAPAPVRIRHRHVPPNPASPGASRTGTGSESKQTIEGTEGQRHLRATNAGAGGAKDTDTDSGTSTTGAGEGKQKVDSGTGAERSRSTVATGKAGAGTGTGKTGSVSDGGKAGSGAGAEKSSSGAGGERAGAGVTEKGAPETGAGAGSANRSGDTATHTSEASGTGATSGQSSASRSKKHLIEEEQLPNL